MWRTRTTSWWLATGASAIGFLTLVGISAAAPSGPVGRQAFFLDKSPGRIAEQPLTMSLRHGGEPATAFPATVGGRVRVVIETASPKATRAAVERAGGRVERSWRNLVQVAVPPSGVDELSRRASDVVRAPMRMFPDAVAGEEVAGSLASAWHAKGLTGKGTKVAIIDGGFQGLADRQAAGDLPTNVVTMDFCGGRFATADDHGTGVAEIVHEMAPDAQLYLLCIDTEVDLAAAAAWAASQGVQVVNHSVSWFGPFRGDGSGPIGAVAAAARAAGILWVNSSGNYAQTHWSGTFVSADGDKAHDWAPGDEGNTFVWPNDSGICGFLRWDEWPAGVSDFDLVLFLSATSQILAVSAGDQTGSQPPFEALCVGQRTGIDLTVAWGIIGYDVRSSPRLDLFTFSPPLQYQTATGSLGDPAVSSAALAVGALCWQSKQLEPYSSQGPTIDGRTKPEIAGHDSVSNATYGPFSSCPSGFAGTSASSPEVAGAAALVKQAYPAYGPDQLQQYLIKSARDLGAPGIDSVTGAGELQLPTPPDLVKPTATALASPGRKGTMVKLLSSVRDDSGLVAIVDQMKRNGRVVATLKKSDIAATSPKQVSLLWKAPVKPIGTYQHCVVARDASGNESPASCAKIALR